MACFGRTASHVRLVELRIGRAHGTTPWGIGLRDRTVATWREWQMQASFDLWRQPPGGETAVPVLPPALRMGAQVRGRAERPVIPVWFSERRASLVVELGVKSSGFVPGEPLGRGVNVRAGVGLPLGR